MHILLLSDNAFGLCQVPFSPEFDSHRHLLGSETTKLLERELTRLFAGGYRWRHQYTQCVVQNILYANRHKISYDPGLCSRLMQFTLPNVVSIDFYYSPLYFKSVSKFHRQVKFFLYIFSVPSFFCKLLFFYFSK